MKKIDHTDHMLEWISEEVLPRAEADPELSLEDVQRLLTSWLMTGSSETAPDNDEQAEAVTHTRGNVHDFPDHAGLKRAFDALNTRSNPAWGRFVFMHGVLGAIVHGGVDRFLPWHRLMIWKFEQLIRATRGGPSLHIPYWTWWQPPGNSRKGVPSAWSTYHPSIQIPDPQTDSETARLVQLLLGASIRRLFGDSSSAMARRIVSALTHPDPTIGSLAGRSLRVTRTSARALEAGTPSTGPRRMVLPSKAAIRNELQRRRWRDFTSGFESQHGTPHVYVGDTNDNHGLMRLVELSPADPLFFMHHCEVDRLWHLRQQRVRDPVVSVSGTDMPPWAESMSQVWDISGATLQVAYANLPSDDVYS